MAIWSALRKSKKRSAKRIGLALSGGGARGLAYIEFCKAMDDLGVRPSIVSGTSIGAIFGAFIAADFTGRRMEQELEILSPLKIPKLIDVNLKKAVLKGQKVMEYLQKVIGVERFEDLSIPLKIVAADYWRREPVIFERGPLMPAVRASISLPAIFKPLQYQGRVLIDGGAVDPLPHEIIRDQCDYLIAIDVSGSIAPTKGSLMPGMFDSIMETFQTMQSAIIAEKLKRTPVDLYVKPRLLNYSILDFLKEKEIRASVALDVAAFRQKLKADLHLL